MKLYMFRTVPLSIIRSYSLYTQQWCMSYRFLDSFRAAEGWNCSSILTPSTLAKCTSTVSYIWPDDGLVEPKYVAEFLILITNICCVID
jgi:hypothetical protein